MKKLHTFSVNLSNSVSVEADFRTHRVDADSLVEALKHFAKLSGTKRRFRLSELLKDYRFKDLAAVELRKSGVPTVSYDANGRLVDISIVGAVALATKVSPELHYDVLYNFVINSITTKRGASADSFVDFAKKVGYYDENDTVADFSRAISDRATKAASVGLNLVLGVKNFKAGELKVEANKARQNYFAKLTELVEEDGYFNRSTVIRALKATDFTAARLEVLTERGQL